MRNIAALISLVVGLLAMCQPAHSQDAETYNDTIMQLVRYTLVYLKVNVELPDGTHPPDIEATGFLVSDDGYIVTAKHVAMSQTRWEQFSDKLIAANKTPLTFAQEKFHYWGKLHKNDAESFELIPIGASDTADIAVLKLKTLTDRLRAKDWPILPIVSLSTASVKMKVAAWGFGAGAGTETQYGPNFTSTISEYGVMYDGKELVRANLGLQPGSSGGPVFNRRGHIVGVVYGGRALQSDSYFTPGNVVVKFLDQLGVVR
jgi:S1-C subfamily serine protease